MTRDPAAFEVLVVDDGHSPETKDLVQAFALRCADAPRIRYLESRGTRGPAGARNVGWREARAMIVAFTDDDTIPQPEWLSEALAAVKDENTVVTGRTVVGNRHCPQSSTAADVDRVLDLMACGDRHSP